VYFILGYLLFAVLSAGIGAISSSSREGQQLIGIFTLPLLIPIWFISLIMLFPNNPVWVVLTIFPVTAPVQVLVRLGVSDVPAWQLAASITVLALSIIGALLLTSRVFRTYLLMYGKRPKFGEIIQSLRSG
jgi:ABC-2 type transport system permease protein